MNFAGEELPDNSADISDKQIQERWQAKFPNASDDAIGLLQQLLIINPTKRATAASSQTHPYVKDFADPTGPANVAHFEVTTPFDENQKYPTSVYRDELYKMIQEAFKHIMPI